jgi:hypothetical protein
MTLPILFSQPAKPLVVVVDAGTLYDPFVQALERAGLPVFRRADHAIESLRDWVNVP